MRENFKSGLKRGALVVLIVGLPGSTLRAHFSLNEFGSKAVDLIENTFPMTAKDIKIEIQKVLDEVSESQLESILSYLKEVQKAAKPKFADPQHLQKVLTEDKELLKKLAQ
jgi:hypothetical protein